jgi:hypothetical protein
MQRKYIVLDNRITKYGWMILKLDSKYNKYKLNGKDAKYKNETNKNWNVVL